MLDRLRAGLAAADDAGGSAALRAADRGRNFAALPLTPREPVVMHGLRGRQDRPRQRETLLGCSHRMVQKHLQRMDASSRARVVNGGQEPPLFADEGAVLDALQSFTVGSSYSELR